MIAKLDSLFLSVQKLGDDSGNTAGRMLANQLCKRLFGIVAPKQLAHFNGLRRLVKRCAWRSYLQSPDHIASDHR